MEHNDITEIDLWAYVFENSNEKTNKKVESWMNSGDFDNLFSLKIIDILWKII